MFGFFIALIAGFLTRHAEDPLTRPLLRRLGTRVVIEPGEVRLVSFVIVMLLAGLLAALLHSGSPFWVILGGAVGYFATRLLAAAQAVLDGRKR
jgi:hypothetical protein